MKTFRVKFQTSPKHSPSIVVIAANTAEEAKQKFRYSHPAEYKIIAVIPN